jgi:SAM-dependent methyltransferase
MSQDPFKKLYDDISSRKAKPEDYAPYEGGNGRIDRAVDLILNEDFPRAGTLLDVGGATGNLGYALRDHFSERYTLDISDVCRGPAEKKGNHFIRANTDVDGIPWPEAFDLIVALDFIEHIVDPQKFASECFRTLKPGGKVLINTPNIQFWRHLHSLVVEGKFPHTSGDREVYHGGHVAFFNFQDMADIFGQAGFLDHRMHTRGLTPEPPAPIWPAISKVGSLQLSFPDLIYSCRKP